MSYYKFIILLYCNILMRETDEGFLYRFIYFGAITAIVFAALFTTEHFIIPPISILLNRIIRHLRERYLADRQLVPRWAPENFPDAVDFLVRFNEFRHFA